jgi:hypothetical protein
MNKLESLKQKGKTFTRTAIITFCVLMILLALSQFDWGVAKADEVLPQKDPVMLQLEKDYADTARTLEVAEKRFNEASVAFKGTTCSLSLYKLNNGDIEPKLVPALQEKVRANCDF